MEKKEYTSPYDFEGKIPLKQAIILGLQHVLAMFVGNLTPVLIITGACAATHDADVFAAIQVSLLQNAMLIAGVVTLVQLFSIGPIGGKVPIIMGTSSGFIGVFQSIAHVMGGGVLGYGAIMGASIIDGKALAAATKAEAAEKVTALKAQGVNPCLAVILVGENPASQVYVRGKINDCAQCGIESRSINLPADTTQETLLAEVKKLADDPAVHGILVQLPLPEQIDEKAVIDAIPPEKDVDGFSPINVGRMQIGEPCYLPCTPAGCIRMIESTGTEIAGKNAVVIGRSNIVGKPAALLLLAKNATVTICHSKTKNLKEVCAAADILVAAVGREGFVTGDMVKPGAVVIDVGINRGADGKLHGDVNFAEAGEKAGYITPVPGGVGPMTRAMLMLNTVEAAARQSGKTL